MAPRIASHEHLTARVLPTTTAPPGGRKRKGDTMADQAELAQRFLVLHQQDSPLLLANAWDEGSAKILRSAGFAALATTSSGFAATLGRGDYRVTREEAVAHAGAVAAASGLPVSADFENCFADDAAGIAATVRGGREAGLAGCSIEDWDPVRGVLYDIDVAAARVAAAANAAHSGPVGLALTARSGNHPRW